jgi:hypothetical protein
MLNSLLSDALVRQQSVIEELKTTDAVGSVLTLTRTDNLAITTAGTIISWQTELRNYEYIWSGPDIFTPEAGWYLVSLAMRTNTVITDCVMRVRRNGLNAAWVHMLGGTSRTAMYGSAVVYYDLADAISVNVLPSANVNIVVSAEGTVNETPILHIVQLSGPVGD